MYTEKIGYDLFEADTQVIVNAANCVGVMGGGIALAFAQRFPESMLRRYQAWCRNTAGVYGKGILQPGRPMLDTFTHPWILHFPTKFHYCDYGPKLLNLIESGLKYTVEHVEEWGIESIAFPKLGCGLAGLLWEEEVQPLFQQYLADAPFDAYVYDLH